MGNSRSSLLLQEENIAEISRETGCESNLSNKLFVAAATWGGWRRRRRRRKRRS